MLERASAGEWLRVGSTKTATDGRAANLAPAGAGFAAGTYRLVFDTGAYFQALGVAGFYPEVVVVFEVRDPAEHHHVPLLLSPYGYSTYRGS
jgi:5-hydroxyisourate hydrolase